MTLDSSVMNVSIATVAKDVGTTVTGIQGAITAYTLVMAALMITGRQGRRDHRPEERAFAIVASSTAAAPSRPRSRRACRCCCSGWSLLEGVGAALILPAIVALVAGNFPAEKSACGVRASWRPPARRRRGRARWSAASARPISRGAGSSPARSSSCSRSSSSPADRDAPVEERPQLDVVGSVLSALGLGLLVLRRAAHERVGLGASETGRPVLGGESQPSVWLVLAGCS
jgi:hypothetical protein